MHTDPGICWPSSKHEITVPQTNHMRTWPSHADWAGILFLWQTCIMKPNRNITQCLHTLFSPMTLSRNCSQAYETLTLLSKSMITTIHLCSADFFSYISFNHPFNTAAKKKNALLIMWKTLIVTILLPSLKIKEVHANSVHVCQKTIGTLLPRQLLNWSREGHPAGNLAKLIFNITQAVDETQAKDVKQHVTPWVHHCS